MAAGVVELAFDPSQPRDMHGRWAHTPSWKPEHSREAAASGRQQSSGLWGGRSYAEHTAALSRLTPQQRRVYVQATLAGRTPGQALGMAQARGRSRLPRPPAAMNTPDMRFAIRAGLLAADNRLGIPDKIRGGMGYANTGLAVELARTPAAETAAGRKSAAGKGLALKDGSFPVPDAAHWDKARQAIGRVKDARKRAAVARLLRKTAPRFGKTAALKASWAAPGGSSHANDLMRAIEMAREAYSKHPGEDVKCPNCGSFNMPDAKFCDQCGQRLPESAFANLSNPMELAMPTNQPIRTPSDLLISRGENGVAIIRHRMGAAEIGTIRRDGRGWRAAVGGRDLELRTHQRTALADVIGTHNRGALTPEHRPSAGPVLQPPAQQTPLMAQYGIPAIRALATPTTGAGDGPRVTSSDSDSGGSSSGGGGLNAKGQQIYKKLKARGFPEARAMAFARRAQNMGSS